MNSPGITHPVSRRMISWGLLVRRRILDGAGPDVLRSIAYTYYYTLGSGTAPNLYHYLMFNFAALAVRFELSLL